MNIEQATTAHVDDVTSLALLLWPDNERDPLRSEFAEMVGADRDQVFVAREGEETIGFIHVSIRVDYVEGSTTSPVGFIEGIYVLEQHRGQGVSRQLVEAAADWSLSKGCRELASDTELHNTDSQAFHERIGFREAGRTVTYIKDL
ncbi:aminoglycoside 6'-N-acetyltransferase [Paenibacillus daejeonensis]|uniref:aminoglycoside 6'-N-acetyltransferase n=1 Tax=Paenibacillus daejeonensis TaxID=135193 RepID=UPI00036D0D5B|nr:aminoglycoside 6'-N-acetyltransferase [Paenibacillus daejeonensis]